MTSVPSLGAHNESIHTVPRSHAMPSSLRSDSTRDSAGCTWPVQATLRSRPLAPRSSLVWALHQLTELVVQVVAFFGTASCRVGSIASLSLGFTVRAGMTGEIYMGGQLDIHIVRRLFPRKLK